MSTPQVVIRPVLHAISVSEPGEARNSETSSLPSRTFRLTQVPSSHTGQDLVSAELGRMEGKHLAAPGQAGQQSLCRDREAVEKVASEVWSDGQRRQCWERSWDTQGLLGGWSHTPLTEPQTEESHTCREDRGQARFTLFLPLVN